MKILKGRNTITTDVAYIAGLFDGEGCVRIKHANQGGNSYYVIAHITNTNKKMLDKVEGLFGGNTRIQEKGRNKKVYNWYITSSEASDFLKVLSPFLIEKEEQAKLAIYFHEHKEGISAVMKEKYYKTMMKMKKEIIGNIYENEDLLK